MPAAFRNAAADALCMVAVLLLAALAVFLFGGAAMQRVVTYAAIMLTAVLGLQIFSGNSGIVSFGHAAFVGLGAYATGILTMPAALQRTTLRDLPQFLAGHELSFFAALAVVLVLAVVVGLMTGTPLLRLSGSSASIATLAMLIIVYTLLVAGREITRGSQPFYGVPREVGLWTAIGIASVALAVARLFRETVFGLATRAAANDERGAAAVGVDQRIARLAAWVVSAVAAMSAGAMMAQFLGAFSPRDFYFDLGFTLLAMLIVGGMNSSLGAFAGVVVTIAVIEVVRRFEGGGEVLGLHLPVLFGLTQGVLAIAMILVIWRRPTGLFGERELNLLRRPGSQAVNGLEQCVLRMSSTTSWRPTICRGAMPASSPSTMSRSNSTRTDNRHHRPERRWQDDAAQHAGRRCQAEFRHSLDRRFGATRRPPSASLVRASPAPSRTSASSRR